MQNERLLKEPLEEAVEWSSALQTWVVNREVAEAIEGAALLVDWLTEEQERRLVDTIDAHPFSQVIQRRQQFYGQVYFHTKTDNTALQPMHGDGATKPAPVSVDSGATGDTGEASVTGHGDSTERNHPSEATTPLDIAPMQWILDQCIAAGFFGPLEHMHPKQLLVNEYLGRIGIRSHFEDFEAFGPVIVTLSLLSPIWMTLKKPVHAVNSCPSLQAYTRILLPPRSCFIMEKECR
ncbi:hypothetical protein HDU91_001705, partial [Kappamyces sp. JEL0680]